MPVLAAAVCLLDARAPDLLISGDGRYVGIAGEGERLLVLREGRSDFARDNLMELAGVKAAPVLIEQWPNATCSRDFCSLTIERGQRNWHILMARSRSRIEERPLAAACEQSDIVIAERWLPGSCRPRWLKADRNFLDTHGGLAIYLAEARTITVGESEGEHPWWTASRPEPRLSRLVVPAQQAR